MAFVNEYIPAEDFKKYDFDRLNKRQTGTSGSAPSDSWTTDRELDIWLREFYTEMDHTAPQGGYTGVSAWDFFWKGHLFLVKLKSLDTGGGRGKHCWARKKLLEIDIPIEIEDMRPQIIKDLEAALAAYKDGGVFSTATSFSFTLEV